MSIISLFSLVDPSLTNHSYSDKESVQTISGIKGAPSCVTILFIVILMTIAISTSFAIAYISEARTLLVTCLHLVDDQWIMLPAIVKDSFDTSSLDRIIT